MWPTPQAGLGLSSTTKDPTFAIVGAWALCAIGSQPPAPKLVDRVAVGTRNALRKGAFAGAIVLLGASAAIGAFGLWGKGTLV